MLRAAIRRRILSAAATSLRDVRASYTPKTTRETAAKARFAHQPRHIAFLVSHLPWSGPDGHQREDRRPSTPF